MISHPLVGIIITNYNTPQDVLDCYASLQQLDYPNYKLVVVDNGSTDNSVAILNQHLPAQTVVATGQNLGFAGGNNVGIRQAQQLGCQAFWLLNADTEVAATSLGRMVQALSDGVGAVGSILYFYNSQLKQQQPDPHTIQFCGGTIIWRTGQTISSRQPSPQSIIPTDFVHGASMLIPQRTIDVVGPMPEFYFLNYEETDYCASMTKAGLRLLVQTQASVWHKVGGSMGRHSDLYFYYMHRNVWFFVMRQAPLTAKFLFIPYYFLTMARGFFSWTLQKKSKPRLVFIAAVADALLGKKGKCRHV